MSKFNLSKKEVRIRINDGKIGYASNCFYKGDVKEFIERLKEGIESKKHLLDYQEREFYLKLIDKLAGDKLI